MAEGLNFTASNLIRLLRSGQTLNIALDAATAQEGQSIVFSNGTIRWGTPSGSSGQDGREVELRTVEIGGETKIQWRYTGQVNWTDLINVSELQQGAPGLSAYELAVAEGFNGTIEEWLASLQGGGSFLAESNGTEEAPVIANGGDTDTGIYWPLPDRIAITTGGTTRLIVDTEGATIEGDLIVNGTISGTLDWSDLDNVPSSFTPTSHTHAQSDITGLVTALAGKSDTSHNHALSGLSDVVTTGLQNGYVLAWNSGTSKWTPSEMTGGGGGFSGSWNDLTDKPSTFTPTSHTHAQSDITGLSTALAGKAALSHSHAQSDITGLSTALSNKANVSDLADKVDITSGVLVVKHDTNGNAPRPSGAAVVYWVGTAEPLNAEEADLWFDPNIED